MNRTEVADNVLELAVVKPNAYCLVFIDCLLIGRRLIRSQPNEKQSIEFSFKRELGVA